MNAYTMAEAINQQMGRDLISLGFNKEEFAHDLDPTTQLACLNYLRTVRTSIDMVESELWRAINNA